MELPNSASRIIIDTKQRWISLRLMSSCEHAVRFCLPDVPTPLIISIAQLINPPTRNHDQHVLPGFIHPAPASGFHPLHTPFPGEVQGGDRTLFVKTGGNFDGFHTLTEMAFSYIEIVGGNGNPNHTSSFCRCSTSRSNAAWADCSLTLSRSPDHR